MKPMHLMEAFGALPEEEVARAMHETAENESAEIPDAVFQPADPEPVVRRSPLRVIGTLAASAACVAVVAGFVGLIGKIGRGPGTAASLTDSHTEIATETATTPTADPAQTASTDPVSVSVGDLHPVQLFPTGRNAVMWYDTERAPDAANHPQVNVAAFPDTVFLRSDSDELSMIQNGKETVLCGRNMEFIGQRVDLRAASAYFGDLNYDGFPELCWVEAIENEAETYVCVFDVRAQKQYRLAHNCPIKYQLFAQDGILYAQQKVGDGGVSGRLALRGGEIVYIENAYYGETPKPNAGAALVINNWGTAQYVGEPLDLEGLDIQAVLAVQCDENMSYELTSIQEFARFYATEKAYWNCWRLDTSEVDFTRPGTYNVYLETVPGELARLTYYAQENGEQKSCLAKMETQRTAYAVTLKERAGGTAPAVTGTTVHLAETTVNTTGNTFGNTSGSTTGTTETTAETTQQPLNAVTLNVKGNQACAWFRSADAAKQKPHVRIEAFPEAVFTVSEGEISMVQNGKEKRLCSGMGVHAENACFCDLNFDGYPELCVTHSFGSGFVDERIAVYDLHNCKTYELSDRTHYDYFLEDADGVLYARKYPYMAAFSDSVDPNSYPLGRLEIRRDALQFIDMSADDGTTNAIGTATLTLTNSSWDVKHYIGEPLDVDSLLIHAEATVNVTVDSRLIQKNITSLIYGGTAGYWHCWRLDTSEVDFTQPGKYRVWLETVGGEYAELEYYEFGSAGAQTCTVQLMPQRAAIEITLEARPNQFSFCDEFGAHNAVSYTFTEGETGIVVLENVWGQKIDFTVADTSVVKIEKTEARRGGREIAVYLTGLKPGVTYINAKNAEGVNVSLNLHVTAAG